MGEQTVPLTLAKQPGRRPSGHVTSHQVSHATTRPWAKLNSSDWRSEWATASRTEHETWAVLTTDAGLRGWVEAQHRNLNSVFAVHAGSMLP